LIGKSAKAGNRSGKFINIILGEDVLPMMAVLYNASLTTIIIRQEESLLLNFNMTPHPADSSLITSL